MIRNHEPHSEASEGDIVEQEIPADPADDSEGVQPLADAAEPVSEADWIDQQMPVDDADADDLER